MMGNFIQQQVDKFWFEDEANNLTGYVNCGASVLKKQDFFEGEIKNGAKTVSKITGSYMGHCDFDGVRFWDIRDEQQTQKMFKLNYLEPNPLPSDSTKRPDR